MHPGQTFSKEQLYGAAFGYDGEADASRRHGAHQEYPGQAASGGESPIETVWGWATSGKTDKTARRPHPRCSGGI